jgi:type II secretory pathway pseudopilin PulG
MHHPKPSGFAMLDVLVAVLLLAMALTGTCATLIQAVRAGGDALRATQAADLAADLAEDLRRATSPAQAQGLLADWQGRVEAVLPVAGMAPAEFGSLTVQPRAPAEGATAPLAPLVHLRIRWIASGGEIRDLVLPVAARWEDSP